MPSSENNVIRKFFNYVLNIISLIGSIITILSFYGYNNAKQFTFILLGILFLTLTIFIFLHRDKMSEDLELKYRKLNKQLNKNIKMKFKLYDKNRKLLNEFYDAYDAESVAVLLNHVSCYGHHYEIEMLKNFKENFENKELSTIDICNFIDLYHKYKKNF